MTSLVVPSVGEVRTMRVTRQVLLHNCAFGNDGTGQETEKQGFDFMLPGASKQAVSQFVDL